MTFLNFFQWIQNAGTEIVAAVFIGLSMWMWGRWRGMRAWSRKQFLDRILLSLNLTEMVEVNGEKKLALKLRTLFEKDVYSIFLNEQAMNIVRDKAMQTQIDHPVLRFEKEDAWFILNYVLNEISEKFATGLIKRDMGLPVTTKQYIFCLTCEREGGLRIQKLRIMLMEKGKFENFPMEGDLVVDSPTHNFRVKTLRYMKQLYQKEPHHFMRIELSV